MVIVVGMVLMIITGFNYVSKEEVANTGAVEINKEEPHPVRWSPFIGADLVVGGLFLLIADKRKTSM